VAAAPPGACSSAPKARAPSRPKLSTWPRCVPTATPTNGSTSSRWSCCWVCAEMDEALLLGLDVGTSAVKAVLVRPAGAVAGCGGGEAQLRAWVRNPAWEGFTLPKVLWLRNPEPAAFARLATVLLAKDFVRLRLTGALATEPSDASGTLMFDPAGLRWSRAMLEAVGLPLSLLPEVGGSSEILGHVTDQAGALTGLATGTPVVGGGADNACGAAGGGAIAPGEAVASGGSSGAAGGPAAGRA